jgi:hypothetical protein
MRTILKGELTQTLYAHRNKRKKKNHPQDVYIFICKNPKQFITEIFKKKKRFFVTLNVTLTLQQQFKNHFEDAYTHTHTHTRFIN